MSAFEEREKAFEAKYHLDEEIAFKVNARRDKLLGLWVAERLGLSGSGATDYARTVVESDFSDADHHGMLKKLTDDLAAGNIPISPEKLHREFDRLLAVAKQQIIEEVAHGTQSVPPT